MESAEVSGDREIWLAYLDDENRQVQGFFVLIEQNASYLKIRSGKNILTLPWSRILKVKERL